MTQIKTKIPAELEPAAVGGMVTDSKYVKDRVKNKTQKEINADTEERVSTLEESVGTGGSVDERIAEEGAKHYLKTETYNKTELNNMITTPNQEYVSVTATDQTTAVTDVLPATGAADTVYRVGNWDGSQYDDSVYSEYSWNGSTYIHLSTKTEVGEVYDISAAHATGGELATYTDLAAALGTNGANIPQSLQKGGMSVKYVQTSENKYVQYRYTSSSTAVADFTNVANWEKSNKLTAVLTYNQLDTDSIQPLQEGISNGVWERYSTGYYSKLVDISQFKEWLCKLFVDEEKNGLFTFLKSQPEINQNVDFATGYSNVIQIAAGYTEVEIPSDANYLYFRCDTSSNLYIEDVFVNNHGDSVLMQDGRMILPKVRVINDLTTGGNETPLSAEQGKNINEKLYTMLDVFSAVLPPERDYTTESEIMQPGTYKVTVTGSATKHQNVGDTWGAWFNLYLKNEENTNIRTLVKIPPSGSFTPVDMLFTVDVPFKLACWAYFYGNLSLELKNKVLQFDHIEQEIDELKEELSDVGGLIINHGDVVNSRNNLITGTWENGKGIDGENLSVVNDSNYNITDYISINGGIYSVESSGLRLSDIKLLFFDENKQAVYFEEDETFICVDDTTLVIHTRINNYIILRQSIVDEYAIKYVRIAVRSTYSTGNVGLYKFTRALLTPDKLAAFEKKSNNGMSIRMSWFNRSEVYSDTQILNDMYSLAAIGATLYLDVNNIEIDSTFNTAMDGLGKNISIIAEPNNKILAKSTISSSSYLITYKESEQNINAFVYDENGLLFEEKPIIKGGVYECNGLCGGLYAILSRGLLIEDVTVHNSPTYAIKIDTSPRSGYEYFIHKCRLLYDLMVSADNTAIGGNADDSNVSDVVIIGYKTAVNIPGGSNFIQNVHGWIGFNNQYQWQGSRFIISNGYVTNCYADTYNYGYIMNSGSLGFSCIFVNPKFATTRPINQIAPEVRTACNNF